MKSWPHPNRAIDPLTLTAAQFERWVRSWLKAAAGSDARVRVTRQRKVEGLAGDYAIDVLAETTIFNGAKLCVVVECKRQKTRVKRDLVLTLKAKKDDLGAHKAMMFSTGGFQKGAITYAAKHGIALVQVDSGTSAYITKSENASPLLPYYLSPLVGWLIADDRITVVSEAYPEALADYLARDETTLKKTP